MEGEYSIETLLTAADEAPGFGLNGRSLILQAAQRAAKKHKFSHSASQGSDSTELPAARPHNKQSTASNEESNLQPAASAGFVAGARSFQQDADAIAAPDTVHLAGQLTDQWKTNKVLSAPRRSDVLSSAATDALIDELEPHDQPLVAYINRSSVPRILRQGVAKRLAGQQLARLLQDAGMPVAPAAARSTEAAALRAFAAQAALAQEMSIYRKGVGKQVYMNNAARQQACPSYLPAEARPAQQQGATEDMASMSRPGSTSYAHALQHSSAAASNQIVASVPEPPPSQICKSQSCATAATSEITPGEQRGTELAIPTSTIPVSPIDKEDGVHLAQEASRDAAEGLRLEEAEIDWSGDTVLHQSGQVDADGCPKEEGEHSSWSDIDSEEYDPEGAPLDMDSHLLSPKRRSSEKGQESSAQSGRGAHPLAEADQDDVDRAAASEPAPRKTAPAVHKATLRFVKAILNPLYAAQVISRAVYKFVLLKVTSKVVQGHSADTDAAFLVGESGQIQRLVQDYIRHCQLRGIDQ